jgi:glycosyltransferase involved in cell wall biosynthesis
MRIGIDVRYLTHGIIGGVHTYVLTFVPELIKLAGGHQIFLYADTKAPFELTNLPSHVTVRFLPWKNALSSIYHDFFMHRTIRSDNLDVIHFPANYGFGPTGVKKIITLHDEINILPLYDIIKGHPKNLKTVGMMTYLHLCSLASLRKADHIITVSDYAKRQISRYSGFPPEKITAVHHAPTPDLVRIQEPDKLKAVTDQYNLHRPFVLADGLKNPGVIIRAWSRLPEMMKTDWQLVFFSRRLDVLPVLQNAVANGIATLIVNPPRPDLIALFSQAKVFVFPSWIEGFGIPVLEAMVCGAPVIASDRGSLPEVVGDAGLLIDAEDDAKLAALLENLYQSEAKCNNLRQAGFNRSAQFSWQHTAQNILDCYQEVVG